LNLGPIAPNHPSGIKLCLLLSFSKEALKVAISQSPNTYNMAHKFNHCNTTITSIMPDFTGHVIDHGHLKLLDCLGSGAFGKVYRAVERTATQADSKYYAVKCLYKHQPGSCHDELQKQEIAIQQLAHTHPNIVTLHKVISDDFFTYVILDLCKDGDLFNAITEPNIFYKNNKLVKHTFIQIIDAVQYCHKRGVFHRDIKPENILLSEDRTQISLSDFGLSTTDQMSSDFGCGSPPYMSPECIGDSEETRCGKYSTSQNDIWALGVILANMISGRNPWHYATIKDERFNAYLHDNNSLRQTLPISDGAITILKRIFNLNPLSRISLPELRNEILELDTFFLPEEGTPINKIKMPVHQQHHNHHNAKVLPTMNINQSYNSLLKFNSEEHYYFRSPQVEENFSDFVSPSLSKPPVLLADSGVNSGQESEGPITPITKAVEPETEVPDLDEVVDGFSSITIKVADAGTIGTQKSLHKRRKPFTNLFRLELSRL
jgi:serine/threonine protein kinase